MSDSDQPAMKYECTFVVRSYEMDSFGHVNNAVYLNYLEAARGEYLRQHGLSYDLFREWGAFPVVRRVSLEFVSPLKVYDEIAIEGTFEPLRRTGFKAHQVIVRAASRSLVLDARLELVFTGSSGRPIAVPEIFRDRFLKSPRP
ncbi:MAG: acyl-CoA thioesterase [Chloroflexi bacterium]|nr:acyl-CoA thioesterase [Chloroflexota bacterium]